MTSTGNLFPQVKNTDKPLRYAVKPNPFYIPGFAELNDEYINETLLQAAQKALDKPILSRESAVSFKVKPNLVQYQPIVNEQTETRRNISMYKVKKNEVQAELAENKFDAIIQQRKLRQVNSQPKVTFGNLLIPQAATVTDMPNGDMPNGDVQDISNAIDQVVLDPPEIDTA